MKMLQKVNKNNNNNSQVIQCTLVGDGLVGKTSMTMSFIKETVPVSYTATVFDNYAGNLTVSGQKYKVSVFDTAGQQDYEGLRVFTYNACDVIVVCYSSVDRHSFSSVKRFWLPELRGYVGTKKPVILVATHTDAKTDKTVADQPVTSQEGEQLAKDIGAECFYECSAFNEESVYKAFEAVVTSAVRHKKKKSSIVRKLLGR